MIFRPMLVLTLLLLALLTGCGGGLSGSATGQNASDTEALQERLLYVADVLNEINGYHNEFEDLANESLVSADDLVAQIDELIDMGDQVDPSTLEELIENREELTSDMGFIEVIQNLKVERDAVMGEVLESFKSDIEYYMAQSSEDSKTYRIRQASAASRRPRGGAASRAAQPPSRRGRRTRPESQRDHRHVCALSGAGPRTVRWGSWVETRTQLLRCRTGPKTCCLDTRRLTR